MARAASRLPTVNSMLAAPPVRAWLWTIMSTLTLASARRPKISRGDARMVGQAEEADLGLVAAVGHAAHDALFHDLLLVADDGALVVGRRRARRSWTAPAAARRWAMASSTERRLQHLGAQRGHLQHLLVGDRAPAAGPATRCAGRWCRPRPRRCRCRSGRPSAPRRWPPPLVVRAAAAEGGEPPVAGRRPGSRRPPAISPASSAAGQLVRAASRRCAPGRGRRR